MAGTIKVNYRQNTSSVKKINCVSVFTYLEPKALTKQISDPMRQFAPIQNPIEYIKKIAELSRP
jgi:hypothetical protein